MTERNRWRVPTLVTAIHETAHCVARWVLDETSPVPGPAVKSVTVVPSADAVGLVVMQKRTAQFIALRLQPKDLPEELRDALAGDLRCDVIEAMAGDLAAYRHRHGMLFAAVAGRSWISECIATEWSVADDFGDARRCIDHLSFADRKPFLDAAWSDAASIVHGEWPAIVETASVLLSAETMDGAEIEGVWRRRRRGEKARAKRIAAYRAWAGLPS